MGLFNNKYPYTDFHELNLDWVLSKIKELEEELTNFIGLNTIKYANPILWKITSQYEANTVVIDGESGNAYISIKAVPAGTSLNRNEYWTQIFNYADQLHLLKNQIGADEEQSTTATAPRQINDLVFIEGKLVKITASMIAGDTYVIGSNCEYTTISKEISSLYTEIYNEEVARDTAINAVSSRITANTNSINMINSQISPFIESTKRYVCIGDSLGELTNTPWPTQLKNILGVDGNRFYNMCISGSGLIGSAGPGNTFLAQLQSASITSKETITDILICGGFNDAYAQSHPSGITSIEVENAFQDIKNYIAIAYPNATVYVGFIGYSSDLGTSPQGSLFRMNCAKMCELYRQNAEKHAFKYLNGVEYILHDSALYDTTFEVFGTIFHTNEAGNNRLARGIYNAMKNGSASSYYDEITGLTPVPGVTIKAYGQDNVEISLVDRETFNNGLCEMHFAEGGQYLSFTGLNVPTTLKGYKIATITGNRCAFPSNQGMCRSTGNGVVACSNGTLHYIPIQLMVIGYDLYLLYDLPAGLTVTSIGIYPTPIVNNYRNM